MIEFAIASVPLLLLVVSLLLGLYPGYEAMVRLAERISPRPRHARVARQRRPVVPLAHSVSGGLLIALGHAQRPPPPAV